MANSTALESESWFLTRFGDDGRPHGTVAVHCSPFRIGRSAGLELQLPASCVSKFHAELTVTKDGLYVRDLDSTNGTLVNGRRISGSCRLMKEDLLQFANAVFRVGMNASARPADDNGRTVAEMPASWALELLQFDRLLNERAVTTFAQPIVDLAHCDTHGYELLGRGRVEGLESPKHMFNLATKVDMLQELNMLLRTEAGRACCTMPPEHWYFVNTHPIEIVTPELVTSLEELAGTTGSRRLVIEIHEGAITDLGAIRRLRTVLKRLDMRLAYDDFGAGQARLLELAEASPDYVKFDMQLIQGIDRCDGKRVQLLGALVNMVHELGILALAEGVETHGEAKVCRQIGFDYAQGYYFGRPMPFDAIPTGCDTSLML